MGRHQAIACNCFITPKGILQEIVRTLLTLINSDNGQASMKKKSGSPGMADRHEK